MALVGYFHSLQPRMARAHGIDGVSGKNIRIGASNNHHRYTRKRVEFLPQIRHWPFEIDAGQGGREFRIVGRHQASILLFEYAARAGEPIVRPESWKLRLKQATQDLSAFLE